MSQRIVLPLLIASVFGSLVPGVAGEPTSLEIFEQRIMPIFKSPDPSSCVQCHLAAVDLKEYILPSHEKTFASLRARGLVDIDNPEQSKILKLIAMGEKDLDRGARLIHEKQRKSEYEAFSAWIEACSADPRLRTLPAPAEQAGPKRADAVIRHARKSRVVDSFVRNVWSQRMRCFPCHTPYEIDESNPKHQKAAARAEELALQFGKRIRFFRKTPEETLDFLVERSSKTEGDRLPLINLANPRKSLIVLKPTSKLPPKVDGKREPTYVEPISHMGGLKMHVDDQSYKSFVAWLDDYAKVVGDRYETVDELPADNWYASKHVIMMRDVPKDWPDLARVQLFVHAWDGERGAWSESPVAFTQNSVTPRRIVVGALFLLRPGDSTADGSGDDWNAEDATLAPDKYLIKAFVDRKRRLEDNPTLFLDAEDFAGQAEVRAEWRKGFRNAEKIPGDLLK